MEEWELDKLRELGVQTIRPESGDCEDLKRAIGKVHMATVDNSAFRDKRIQNTHNAPKILRRKVVSTDEYQGSYSEYENNTTKNFGDWKNEIDL